MPLSAAQKRVSLLPGVENHRVGRIIGPDETERVVRCFHARFSGLKLGGGRSARERIAYVYREGKHKGDAADVEASAGDKDRLIEDADRIKATARVRRGRTAERILVEQIVELPAESTPEQRAACAKAFVDSWMARGHSAVAVVHVHGDDKAKEQPHLHVEIAARPVDAAGNVDRSDVLWRGRATVYEERRIVADLVNGTCDPDPPYHPGGFRDIGRAEDTPKGRIPPAVFRPAAAEIRDARAHSARSEAAGEGFIAGIMLANATARESEMYAESAERRERLHERREARRLQIRIAKDAGTWTGRDPGQRARLADAEQRLAMANFANRNAIQSRDEAREERDREKARADAAEEQANGLDKRRRQAEEAAEAEIRELNEKQLGFVTDVHRHAGRDLPDLATGEGQSAAWEFVRAQVEAGLAALERERAREKAEREKKEAEARAAARRKAVEEDAERERQAKLAGNPYRDTPEGELRQGYRQDRAQIDMQRSILGRASAAARHAEAQEGLDAATERNVQRRQAAEARGIELVPPRRRSGDRDEGR